MKDKVYADTNILLYLFDKDKMKKNRALDIVERKPIITTQVINETINNLIKKFGRNEDAIITDINLISSSCTTKFISLETIALALKIKHRIDISILIMIAYI